MKKKLQKVGKKTNKMYERKTNILGIIYDFEQFSLDEKNRFSIAETPLKLC